MNPELMNVAPDDLHPDPLSTLVDQTEAEANGDVGHWLRTAFRARQEGMTNQARALLEAATIRFPLEAQVLHDLARLEEAESNWPATERHWRAFSTLSPTVWWGFAELARALREQGRLEEADAILADSLVCFPQEVIVGIHYARMAEFRGDWPEAVVRWAIVAERFHDRWEGPAGQARGLRVLGGPNEARALLVEAIARLPTQTGLLHELARLEEAERNWPKAEEHWRASLALDPAHWWAHVGLANTLREQGRVAEAEAQFADAQERFPEEAGVFIDHARLAELRSDWPNASARWKLVTELFPGTCEGLIGQARVRREQGQPDVARGFLVHAVDQFPAATGPLHDLARLEEAERNWPAAERCWQAYVTLNPAHWWAHVGLANALLQQGRDPEAERILDEQVGRFGHEAAVLIDHARMADRRGDWQAAQTRWTAVAGRFPHLWDGIGGQVRSLRAQGRLEEAGALLTHASDRFANHDGPLLERAHLGEANGDWADAAEAWRALIAKDERSWWFYWHLLQAECKQRNIEAAFATFAHAITRFPGDVSTVIDFIRILIDEDYLEPARDYIADACSSEHEPSAQDLVRLGQLAVRCEDINRATEIVQRLRLRSLEDAELAEPFRALEHTLAMRIADLARDRLDEPGADQHAEAAPSEGASGHAPQLDERQTAVAGVRKSAEGGSWLRRAVRLMKSKPRDPS